VPSLLIRTRRGHSLNLTTRRTGRLGIISAGWGGRPVLGVIEASFGRGLGANNEFVGFSFGY